MLDTTPVTVTTEITKLIVAGDAPAERAGALMVDERLRLSAEPDGFGFYYGWAERDGKRVRVDVLPPDHSWRGDIKLEGQKPDATAWILYLDGQEFARIERREDLPAALGIEGPPPPRSRGQLSRVRALLSGRSSRSLF